MVLNEKTANHIYDEMIDFAKYAFNKSHAAAYAVVSYQTAYLKYYYSKGVYGGPYVFCDGKCEQVFRIYFKLPPHDEYRSSSS